MNTIVLKRIGAALVDILIVILVLFAVIISVSSITAKANNGIPDVFGFTPFSVQSDSMYPTISKGDYIFVKDCDPYNMDVGDVVTYFTRIDGNRVVNTHTIVEVIREDGEVKYITQGDNKKTNPEPDKDPLYPVDIIGEYTGTRIPLMGTVIDYLSTQLGFFLVILLPVLLFTLYQIYKLVAVIMHNHKVDMLNAAKDNASDEVKEAIIAEYLAKQNKEEVAQEDKND